MTQKPAKTQQDTQAQLVQEIYNYLRESKGMDHAEALAEARRLAVTH